MDEELEILESIIREAAAEEQEVSQYTDENIQYEDEIDEDIKELYLYAKSDVQKSLEKLASAPESPDPSYERRRNARIEALKRLKAADPDLMEDNADIYEESGFSPSDDETVEVKEDPVLYKARLPVKKLLFAVPVLALFFIFFCVFAVFPIKKSYVIEAGTYIPDANVFSSFLWMKLRYATDEEVNEYLKNHPEEKYEGIDTSVPGIYNIYLKTLFGVKGSSLVIEDTTAPVFNSPPEKTAEIGKPFSYRDGIDVSDNSSLPIDISLEKNDVDLRTPGDYEVVYVARDVAGNVVKAEGIIHVIEKTEHLSKDEQRLGGFVEKAVEDIISEDMDYTAKLNAVFDYVQNLIVYSEANAGNDTVKNALMGFEEHKGDCHVYTAVSKALLDHLGIPNRSIFNIDGVIAHEWNLVNIGEGWRHFDTVIGRAGVSGKLCYVTTAQLIEYAVSRGYVHEYDASLYPPIE